MAQQHTQFIEVQKTIHHTIHQPHPPPSPAPQTQSGNLIPGSSGDSSASSPRVVEGVKVRGSGIKMTRVLGLDSEDWDSSGWVIRSWCFLSVSEVCCLTQALTRGCTPWSFGGGEGGDGDDLRGPSVTLL
ncbi:hypothetical protein BTUL_0088g00500 [Botrytis tulipae]|uniref:Uncharacterized protein n=1 Tax=Botrytis tulipae TaxID=87230 RepID=A0A4Z1EQ24_9HELO|nr:hypothetical protein BTUL_0088g00500 [Botrytis tulipae]